MEYISDLNHWNNRYFYIPHFLHSEVCHAVGLHFLLAYTPFPGHVVPQVAIGGQHACEGQRTKRR